MRSWAIQIWENIRFSYWFLPALMAVLAAGLSFLSIQLDTHFRYEWVQNTGWIWSGGPEGARGLLSTVAGSMITVVSLTFSITIVAFSQASSQFGPRLLRNLMKDTGNQIVLGTFTATFIYSLLILRTIRSSNDIEFTPHISVTLAIFLALASLGVLIYFIHHAALAIQAPYLVANVAGDLLKTIDRLFPDESDNGIGEGLDPGDVYAAYREYQSRSTPVLAEHNGYLQGIDLERLTQLSTQHDLVFLLPHRPGHFVDEGKPVALVLPTKSLDDEIIDQIEGSFTFGYVRTYTQDVEFAIDQLVEVAVRALSPGINDPFTAVTCVDWLGTALKKLAGKELMQDTVVKDSSGNIRIIQTKPVTFEGAVEAAFNQIRQNARTNVAVKIRLLETIEDIMESARLQEDRDALVQQARMVANVSPDEVPDEKDRKDISAKIQKIVALDKSLAGEAELS